MRYYLIVGEASGDLHASRLMQSLKKEDSSAEFRFFGGDLMTAVGGTCVKHYRELAYMGFVPVLLHLRTIFRNMAMCKRDITAWQPDVVILVDYPGFNLDIAKYVHAHTRIPVYYYISPKIWAWKEWRIRRIRRDVSELFSILPFEVPFYEGKHHYKIHYVGNPTVDRRWQLDPDRPIIALLAGSRRQEIKDNLPAMIEAAAPLITDPLSPAFNYQLVLAGAPSVDDAYYERFIAGKPVKKVDNDTYALLTHSVAAMVTSGTATLETALFRVPQVVCKYISLVNLIADREIVQELLADRFTVSNIRGELLRLLPGGTGRDAMLADYDEMAKRLGKDVAPDNAARIMVSLLS